MKRILIIIGVVVLLVIIFTVLQQRSDRIPDELRQPLGESVGEAL